MGGNIHSEKWTLEVSIAFMQDSLKLAREKKHDFIGEVARDMDSYRDVYTYLKDKYVECKPLYKKILQECETNCFSHGKNGKINTAMAIVNLKSNHNWTDRVDNTSKGNEIKSGVTLTPKEAKIISDELDAEY